MLRPYSCDVADVTILGSTPHVLSLTADGERHDLHAMWLRDACGCTTCRNTVTSERLLDVDDIADDVVIEGADVRNGTVMVGLSDGHLVTIERRWLTQHLAEMDRSADPAAGCQLWRAGTERVMSWFDEAALVAGAERHRWLDALDRIGVVGVRTARRREAGIRSVAEMIGPIRPTNYGTVWHVGATIEPSTAVDSEQPLRVHTDLPYRDSAPGVQLMMVESNGIEGGASTFVDGFAVAEHLRLADLDSWHLLTMIDFTYPFVRDDIEMHGRAPLIRLRSNGAYAEVRRAPDLVGVPVVRAGDTPALYRAVRQWNALLDGEQFAVEHSVQPGEVIAWNNHRVLHGRTGFELGSYGGRMLFGCYVDIDDFRSARALAERTAR